MSTRRSKVYRVQHDLFAPGVQPTARPSDPATSHLAAESMDLAAETQRADLYAALCANGPLTADELDELLLFRVTTAGRRLIELTRLDPPLARRLERTRLTRSGRSAHLWEALTYGSFPA